MSTVDYGPTPIKNLRREQLELAYIAAIETRDRALAEVDRLTADLAAANQRAADNLAIAYVPTGQDGEK